MAKKNIIIFKYHNAKSYSNIDIFTFIDKQTEILTPYYKLKKDNDGISKMRGNSYVGATS
jgi:hypothetical protein